MLKKGQTEKKKTYKDTENSVAGVEPGLHVWVLSVVIDVTNTLRAAATFSQCELSCEKYSSVDTNVFYKMQKKTT